MSYSLRESKFENQECPTCDELRRNLVTFATPKAFEVGRSILIPLGENEQTNARSHWRPNLSSTLSIIIWMGGILLLYAFLLIPYERWHARRTVLLVGLAILIPLCVTVLVYLADGVNGEPFPLWSGANMLPTLALLPLILISTLFFLTKAHTDLQLNGRRLVRDFKLTDNKEWGEYLLSRGYRTRHERLSRRWMRHRLTVVWLAIVSRPYMRWPTAVHVMLSGALICVFGDFSLHPSGARLRSMPTTSAPW